jgi:hypothetical protein
MLVVYRHKHVTQCCKDIYIKYNTPHIQEFFVLLIINYSPRSKIFNKDCTYRLYIHFGLPYKSNVGKLIHFMYYTAEHPIIFPHILINILHIEKYE